MRSIRSSHAFDNTRNKRPRFLLALLLCCWLGAPLPGLAAPPASTATASSCPLRAPTMKASLDVREYSGRVGTATGIRVRLSPKRPPEGYYVSAIIDVLSGPPGPPPAILTGVPVSDVTPRVPGDYRLRVVVSLIAKSSCGGVKSATLLERVVTLRVR